MMTKFKSRFLSLRNELGQSIVEYALIVGIISVAGVAALTALGNGTNGVFSDVAKDLNNKGGGSTANSIYEAVLETIPAQTYTGSALTPDLTLTLNGKALNKGTDYSVSYENNTNAGTASVVVKGEGGISGTRTWNFEIAKKPVTITWSNTRSFESKNTFYRPEATLSGLVSGDTCEINYDGPGNVAPGSYTCRISSLSNSNYVASANTECSYTITAGSVPCFKAGGIPAKLDAAGYAKQGGEYRIRSVIFSPSYTPTGKETHSFNMDVYSNGSIKGYINPCCTYNGYNYSDLIISGNGAVSIMTNTDSGHLFDGLCHYLNDSLGGGFENLRMLDTSHAIPMSYMFANITVKSLDLTTFYLPFAMAADYMFYNSSIGSLEFASNSTYHITNMSHMFEKCSGMTSANLSKLDTTEVTDMTSMFENSGFSELYVSLITTNVKTMDRIFGGSSSKLSKIHEHRTYSSQNSTTDRPFTGNPNFSSYASSDVSVLKPTSKGGVFLYNPYVPSSIS